jgi:hypothetical protein
VEEEGKNSHRGMVTAECVNPPGAAQHPLEPTAPSALVVSRPFGFGGGSLSEAVPPHPALRLSFSVSAL